MRGPRALTSWATTFEGGKHWPREKSLTKLKDTIRAKTKRTQRATRCRMIIASLNRTLRGWFEYFQHSQPWIFPAARRLDPPPASEPSCGNAAKRRGPWPWP